jgi:glucosamine--fructose-6-phosphate aminotransferase (isomerizing)
MCGVIGLVHEHHRDDLGLIAAELLRTLEYRGYDSTGAAIQGAGEEVDLRKDVGAPSLMVHQLGIVNEAGGSSAARSAGRRSARSPTRTRSLTSCAARRHDVRRAQRQRHQLRRPQAWLTAEGHTVLSDNDGEMVVHTIEHFFALALAASPRRAGGPRRRRRCMRAAISRASGRLQGSFAAVVVDPVSQRMWAIKSGSSLYFGFGHDEVGGRFCIASSPTSRRCSSSPARCCRCARASSSSTPRRSTRSPLVDAGGPSPASPCAAACARRTPRSTPPSRTSWSRRSPRRRPPCAS